MKKLALGLSFILALPFANPDASKHWALAFERLVNSPPYQHGAFATIPPAALQEDIKRRYVIDNYYLFSLSYRVVPMSDGVRRLEGLGLLGTVFDVSNLISYEPLK